MEPERPSRSEQPGRASQEKADTTEDADGDRPETDEPPASLIETAEAALQSRVPNATVARLVYDSVMADELEPLADVGGLERSLAFEGAGVLVEMRVARRARSCTIHGQVIPGRATTMLVRSSHRAFVTLQSDARGQFRGDVPAGPCSLLVLPRSDDPQVPVVTDWVTL